MFTGIITNVGRILSLTREGGDTHLRIATAFDVESIALGASIACNGICLTVRHREDNWFAVSASGETARVTTLNSWEAGDDVNLERALKLGDELGGHLVQGHVDGTAVLRAIEPTGESWRLTFTAPTTLTRFLSVKGSVVIDGISLTVNGVQDAGDDGQFWVQIIAHTWTNTNLRHRNVGDRVNLEVDLLARYIERLMTR